MALIDLLEEMLTPVQEPTPEKVDEPFAVKDSKRRGKKTETVDLDKSSERR